MQLVTVAPFVLALAAPAVADVHKTTVPAGFYSGPQQGIGSWFRASNGGDSTNGNSWCGYKYYNSDPVFAVVSITPRRAPTTTS